MAINEDSVDVPYRVPVTAAPKDKAKQTKLDEGQFDTLTVVQKILHDALDSLYKDFNAFDMLSDGTDEIKKDTMMRKIAGSQIAYDILAEPINKIDQAIAKLNNQVK